MATRFQHYVPQVYLRAWKNSGYDETKGKAKNKGLYYYPKKDLRKGEPRNTNSILAKYHTYTVNYKYSFVFNEMPEIAKDYGKKIIEVLDKHNAVAFYDGKELKNIEQLTSKFTFPYLDEWEFVKRYNPENLARKKAILKDIKAIHSYVIENKLDDFLEKKWVKIRDDFIKAVEEKSQCKTMEDIKIDANFATDLIYSILLLMCRNPSFDCLGIFPKIGNAFMKIFCMNDLDEEEIKMSREVVDQQLHAAWLAEIYKGLFKSKKGFCYVYAEEIQERCQLILLRCPEKNGSFITSDNPAFMYIYNVTKVNRNGFYIPLTPQYLLLIGKGKDDIGSVDVHTLTNQGVRFYNNIILTKATNAVVSKMQYLGQIL